MAAPYASERLLVGSLLSANFSAAPVLWPNAPFTPPTPTSPPATPASYVAFELAYDNTEQTDFAGGYRVDGRVELGVWVQQGCGDELMRSHMSTLYGIFDAVDSSGIYFGEPSPGELPTVEGDWYGRGLAIPFTHFGALTAAEVATLAGVGSTSRTISQTAHGLAAKDWVGFSGSSWGKVAATLAAVRCDGVVSAVLDADTFVLTSVGAVTLTGHGYTLGPLYLSQGSAGAVTSSAPSSGVSQQVGVAIDANTVLVLQMERLSL